MYTTPQGLNRSLPPLMTLTKAIYALAYPVNAHRDLTFTDYRKATDLGIQAMRTILKMRRESTFLLPKRLPGEET